jgi:peptidoglycan/xylan/chitin deacetylase (PgdA/CDA1 family)
MNKKVLCFPKGRKKAVTLSYDDCMEADERLIAMMETYQMRGTFNLIPGWFAKEGTVYPDTESYRLITKSNASRVYDNPLVEVANHGNMHKYMTSLSVGEMTEDIITCRKTLENQFDRLVQGMAYPYGWYNEELMHVLTACGIVYSRTVNSTHQFELPQQWLAWHPTCHHDDEKLMELTDEFIAMNPVSLERPKLMYVWGHTFEFDRNDNWNQMDEFMKKISGRDEIWYATNMEIYEYVRAYERLLVSADGTRIVNPSGIPVWTEIDGTVYKIEKELVL